MNLENRKTGESRRTWETVVGARSVWSEGRLSAAFPSRGVGSGGRLIDPLLAFARWKVQMIYRNP